MAPPVLPDVLPAPGWDCHAHLFGPYERYPLAAQRSYTPPAAPQAAYAALLAQLGLGHGVLVHPSACGGDHRLVLDTLLDQPAWRGVLVSRQASTAQLRAWRDAGVRGLRFSQRSGVGTNFPGSAAFSDLLQLAPQMARADLHAELWTDSIVLPDMVSALAALPVPVVIDHMGGFDHRAGPDAPGFLALVELVRRHPVWVKLCAYRNLRDAPDADIGRLFLQRLCDANPGQLVWGSDWPHLNVQPVPSAAGLLQQMVAWADNPLLVRQILVDNPARLYG